VLELYSVVIFSVAELPSERLQWQVFAAQAGRVGTRHLQIL
jgi:hypothetical protein